MPKYDPPRHAGSRLVQAPFEKFLGAFWTVNPNISSSRIDPLGSLFGGSSHVWSWPVYQSNFRHGEVTVSLLVPNPRFSKSEYLQFNLAE